MKARCPNCGKAHKSQYTSSECLIRVRNYYNETGINPAKLKLAAMKKYHESLPVTHFTDKKERSIDKVPPHTASARASSPPTSHTQATPPTSQGGTRDTSAGERAEKNTREEAEKLPARERRYQNRVNELNRRIGDLESALAKSSREHGKQAAHLAEIEQSLLLYAGYPQIAKKALMLCDYAQSVMEMVRVAASRADGKETIHFITEDAQQGIANRTNELKGALAKRNVQKQEHFKQMHSNGDTAGPIHDGQASEES